MLPIRDSRLLSDPKPFVEFGRSAAEGGVRGMTIPSYGSDGLPDLERKVYSALCSPGITTGWHVAEATGLSPHLVEEVIQTLLLSRYYIHILSSGGYIVR